MPGGPQPGSPLDPPAGWARSPEVVLVRHGETEWSKSGRHTGRTDVPLTEHGRQEARHLGVALDGRSFAHAWCSPLSRARDTFELSGVDAPVEILDDLLEWDYGDYEGVSTAEVRRTISDWSVWTHPVTGGESVEAVGERADGVIARLLEVGGDTVLFAHGQYLRILAARWIGLPAEAGRLLSLDTAAVSVLGYERETRVIRRWNQSGYAGESNHRR
ncbi:MAG: histidine phosphatase family protein [Candidatus Microthrix sp.]|uniref:Histidine phosphatase family protein n=1 Tax=Candidatus Neomicrothrix subdominans TaxID=2954438 RepID=A0A936TDI3_9ACTN|nr:histidine phosphatase family protein [Candidatus Microthrix subdominans]